jgi:hypothetical protein
LVISGIRWSIHRIDRPANGWHASGLREMFCRSGLVMKRRVPRHPAIPSRIERQPCRRHDSHWPVVEAAQRPTPPVALR